jgi:hypothetical protein
MPDLPARRDFRPLADRAETQMEDLRVFCRGAVEGGAALSTEGLRPFRAAVGSLHVDAGAAAQQAEIGGLCWHAGPVRRPGEALAIQAMADVSHFRVNLGRVNDGAAMASPVDSQDQSSGSDAQEERALFLERSDVYVFSVCDYGHAFFNP